MSRLAAHVEGESSARSAGGFVPVLLRAPACGRGARTGVVLAHAGGVEEERHDGPNDVAGVESSGAREARR